MDNIYAKRISALREVMRGNGWDAVVFTGSDPHSSEYPAERYKQVRWLTGFTGEAGDVAVTADHAGLWTDTRYFIQANTQLKGTGATLHKTKVPEQVLIPEWLHSVLPEGATVAVDSLCISEGFASELREHFNLAGVPDLLSGLWADRPKLPCTPIFTVETGESRLSKLDWLRDVSREKGCEAMLLSTLDDIAWLLNVRASDIEYNPLAISYLIVPFDRTAKVRWFVVKDGTADCDAFETLRKDNISIERYDAVRQAISCYSSMMVDSGSLNAHMIGCLKASNVEIVPFNNPVPVRKAVKNAYEIEKIRECQIRDGVVMEIFLHWLETSVQEGVPVSEWDASVRLGSLRAEDPAYMGDSFETISAYGPGAALPHYVTPSCDAPMLEPHGLYLVDSGGQYLDGTTDITRTVPLGECTSLEKEDYTLVLKGHIDLSRAIFPAGTAGCQIDALARAPLWQARRNFGHGTGHGVGFFLGVHELPLNIRQNFDRQSILPGMVTSDEPGIYREGMHGVRHENLVLCVEDSEGEFGRWLRFEPLTLCHFDTSALLLELMTRDELLWLNAYNAKVYETLSPLLPGDVADWLKKKTEAIPL